jgi:hypothetical protein
MAARRYDFHPDRFYVRVSAIGDIAQPGSEN